MILYEENNLSKCMEEKWKNIGLNLCLIMNVIVYDGDLMKGHKINMVTILMI